MERIMDSNDFIFSDDIAESLGSRTTEADSDAFSAETRESASCSGKGGLAAMGGVGFGILSFMEFLDL
jgi:hypothetical protein